VPDNDDNSTDVRVQVGSALKRWRTDRRLTQEELASRSDLSYKFIGEIERGVANPTIKTLSTLARALDVEIVELIAEPDHVVAQYQLSRKQVQRVREAAETIDTVLRQLTGSPVRRTRRRKT
jgi:transcriptional regulator with XRE-family HTH domain